MGFKQVMQEIRYNQLGKILMEIREKLKGQS